MGAGAISCGKWSKEESRGMKNLYLSWVLGYLSGMNFLGKKIDGLKNTDSDAIESAIDKFCLENPLSDIHYASNDVFLQLLKKNAR